MLPHSGSWGKRRLSSRLVWTSQWDPQPQQENQIFPYIILEASPICTPKDFLSYNIWATSSRKDLSFFFVLRCAYLGHILKGQILISSSVKSGWAQGCQPHAFNREHAQWRVVSTPERRWGMNSDTHCLSHQRQKQTKENKEIQKLCGFWLRLYSRVLQIRL